MISVLSNGFPDDDWNTDGFDAMAAALRDPAGLNATIRTIGVGSTAGTADLDRIDDGAINGSVSVATTLAELNGALMATPRSSRSGLALPRRYGAQRSGQRAAPPSKAWSRP